jgi:hypothetical protein
VRNDERQQEVVQRTGQFVLRGERCPSGAHGLPRHDAEIEQNVAQQLLD